MPSMNAKPGEIRLADLGLAAKTRHIPSSPVTILNLPAHSSSMFH